MPEPLYLDLDQDLAAREATEFYARLIAKSQPKRSQRILRLVHSASKVEELIRRRKMYDETDLDIAARAAEIFASLTDDDGVLIVPPDCDGSRTKQPGIREIVVGDRRQGNVEPRTI